MDNAKSNNFIMNRGYKKLIYRIFLLLLPLIALVIYYIIADPFKVIYNYYPYMDSGTAQIVPQDKDHISVKTFLHNYQQYHYDSYIFGSSRSMFYRIDDWKPYIHSDKCFHFDAAVESLYGIYIKFKFLEKKHVPIKNALIIVDQSLLSMTSDAGYKKVFLRKDPILSGSSQLGFQYDFMKLFFQGQFLIPYFDYKIRGKIKPYMYAFHVFNEHIFGYNKITNEVSFPRIDSLIKSSPELYYGPKKHLFFKRPDRLDTSKECIHAKQKVMLSQIHRILVADHTDYRIIISPMYMEVKFNPADLVYLKQLFGSNKVFDFSGKNAITENRQNFYDPWHYRPPIAKHILSVAYANDTAQ